MKVYYLCDGEDPNCERWHCWKDDENDGSWVCRKTSNIEHAVNFHKAKHQDYYSERCAGDDDDLFTD